MLFFTDMLAFLPTAALAAIVANAVLSLIEVHDLKELWRIRRSDFWIAIVCLLSVLALGPLQAVIIAFLLASVDVIRRAAKPGTWVLQEAPDGSHFLPREIGQEADASGLVIYRFGSPLYFANATLFLEEVERLVAEAETSVRWFVLDAEAMVDVDTTGAESFHEALKLLADRGVTFALSRASQPLLSVLQNYELLDLIPEDRRFPTNRQAADAFRREVGQ